LVKKLPMWTRTGWKNPSDIRQAYVRMGAVVRESARTSWDAPAMTINASKPTPLRLWGFLLTVIGGVLCAFGALQVWVTPTLNGQAPQGWQGWVGIDLTEGLVAIACGIVLIVGILALRLVRRRSKRVVAILLIIAGMLAFAVSGAVVATASSRFTDPQTAAKQVAASEHISLAQALAKVGSGSSKLTANLKIGVFMTMLGGILGAIGGVLSVALVARNSGRDVDDNAGEAPQPTSP
jgi:hypothetical protein